jgi:alpha-aminoadipic semialdehyde synthase
MVISDISCDIEGSIECLLHPTSINNPSYIYDPITGQEVDHGRGITVMGVDILPTELPVESSEHFGNQIVQIIEEMANAKSVDGTMSIDKLSPSVVSTISSLGHNWFMSILFCPLLKSSVLSLQANAFISDHEGALRPKFRYIDQILKRAPKVPLADDVDEANTLVISMYGHLFDSGLINQVLDVLDNYGCGFEFKEVHVRHRETGSGDPIKSSATLEIQGTGGTDFAEIESKIKALVTAIESADASYSKLNAGQARGKSAIAHVTSLNPEKRVLLLGSGMVSKSAVELLGRTGATSILVASNDNDQARDVAKHATRGEHVCFDVGNDDRKLSKLIRDADAVVSLLPVPMHPRIAEFCIDSKTDLVTASYESEAMKKLGQRVKEAGIKILNEVGLDPGLDHMSAMKIIDDVRERGGSISSFVSVCGGLPSPEAADNPLKYKFSWSPRGVISASQNAAKYRWEDHIVEVSS